MEARYAKVDKKKSAEEDRNAKAERKRRGTRPWRRDRGGEGVVCALSTGNQSRISDAQPVATCETRSIGSRNALLHYGIFDGFGPPSGIPRIRNIIAGSATSAMPLQRMDVSNFRV